MIHLPKDQAVMPDQKVTIAFALAIAEYSRVLQGQTVGVAALCHEVTTRWLQGTSDLLTALDRLRADLDGPANDIETRAMILTYAQSVEKEVIDMMTEVQRHDMIRQMLEAICAMAAAIGKLDLAVLLTSAEAASLPQRIAQTTAAGFVMAEQHQAIDHAPDQPANNVGPDLELF